ncbi:MAG: hypothetical protein ACM3TN_01055 [Alphaproteobacteria bacterium]
MLPKRSFLLLISLAFVLSSVSAFSQTTSEDPTQLGSRQLEIRALDVNYDVAYRSATQALLSLGYSITHSDKTSGILTGSRTMGVTQMKEEVKRAKEEMKEYQEQVHKENTARTVLGFVPYVGWLASLFPGSQPPEQKDIKEPSSLQITMLLQPMGNKETQIRFKMQKDGEPVWDQVTIDRLWVTTQREAMIESGPPPAVKETTAPPAEQEKKVPAQKAKEPAKK